jgi:hypothetical protein
MAEYKIFHCPYGDDFGGGDVCDRCEKYELCMETPNADVVERSKIDKAIEEIQSYKHGNGNMFTCGLNKAIEILKRNIGE